MNRIDFQGRTAVVTGGAMGIGLAVAQRLVASGGRVSLWDRNADALDKARTVLGGATEARVVDVTDAGGVDAAAKATATALGRIDALVCSAGITGPNVTLAEYPVDAWRQVIEVNVNGVFHCNRAAVPIMQRQDYGRIVNIASVAGKEGNPNASAYSTSKAAVIGLTKSLARSSPRPAFASTASRPRRSRPRSSTRCRSSTSSSCSPRYRWAASARSKRSRRSWRGCAARIARSRPARCSTCRGGGRRIEGLAVTPARRSAPSPSRHCVRVRCARAACTPRWRS